MREVRPGVWHWQSPHPDWSEDEWWPELVSSYAIEFGDDLLLFDPTKVARGPKRRVHDLPTGASRLDTPAVGLHGVWVNGVRTVDEGGVRADCGRPGQVLRDFGP